MALFESYERRIEKINSVLAKYGINSVEETREICKAAGFDPYEIVKSIQPICFENVCWAYCMGAAIAIKMTPETLEKMRMIFLPKMRSNASAKKRMVPSARIAPKKPTMPNAKVNQETSGDLSASAPIMIIGETQAGPMIIGMPNGTTIISRTLFGREVAVGVSLPRASFCAIIIKRTPAPMRKPSRSKPKRFKKALPAK